MEKKTGKNSVNGAELSKQLQEIKREKKILDAIIPYYDKLGTFDYSTGVTLLEFKNYLEDKGFTEIRKEFLEKIEKKIETRKNELERSTKTKEQLKLEQEELEIQKYLDKRAKTQQIPVESQIGLTHAGLGSLKQIIFIPSWNKLIQTDIDFKGFYLNEPVLEIINDNIVFLPEFMVTGFEETRGDPFVFFCGVGIYYVKFRLRPGEIIDDYREITGIVLPIPIYEKAQDLSRSLVQSQEELLMTEYMTTIPFSLMLAEQTKQMFLRGVIARNIYHPYKESFIKLVEVCDDPNSFKEGEGLKVLSGGLSQSIPVFENELLTEIELDPFSRHIAGIKNIQPKLSKIISDLQIEGLRKPIFKKIGQLKKDFIKIGYPRLLDWMP
ncbi:MAG: hypothetical protein ACFE95_18240 [Candidatus Hodarchaeota archaeon]